MMKEALLYQKMKDNTVRCYLCAHRCVIHDGKKGICKVRENHGGTLFTRVYGHTIAQHTDPIEKKPLYHFYPGSKAYSIATPGCNFHCRFCQNWDISQIVNENILNFEQKASPEEVVLSAKQKQCKSIAYTYTEPTIFFEYSYDIARLANEKRIQNIYVSNGYMTSEMLEMISPYLDAINVDLKAFRDVTYRRLLGSRLQPVLDSLKKIKQLGIWLEVTSLIIPGINDEETEIREMANFVAEELGKDVPWHISRYFPAYEMEDVPPTPVETLFTVREIGRDAGLNYVYIGNLGYHDDMDTKCPQCGQLLIKRSYFGIVKNTIREHHCPNCGLEIAGVGM
ncbi:MAG: AmmeMemoRadiSam system radical SAM enzyme [Fidelibacterota bacterium]